MVEQTYPWVMGRARYDDERVPPPKWKELQKFGSPERIRRSTQTSRATRGGDQGPRGDRGGNEGETTMTEDEINARQQMAMGYMITSPLYQQGLTSLGQRMPRDRGPDQARELRAMARLAAEQELLKDSEEWQDSTMGKRALAGASPQEQEYLMNTMGLVRRQVADALATQQKR